MLRHDIERLGRLYTANEKVAGVFEAMVHDLRVLLRRQKAGRPSPRPLYSIIRMLCSTPESGHRADYDGANRKKDSKLHAAVDTLGHLLALHVKPGIEHRFRRWLKAPGGER